MSGSRSRVDSERAYAVLSVFDAKVKYEMPPDMIRALLAEHIAAALRVERIACAELVVAQASPFWEWVEKWIERGRIPKYFRRFNRARRYHDIVKARGLNPEDLREPAFLHLYGRKKTP